MAHSLSYEITLNNKALVKTTIQKPVIYVVDGRKSDADAASMNVLVDFGILPNSIERLTYMRAIRKGALLYCSLINKYHLTLQEISTMTRIIMMAIAWNKELETEEPFRITKDDLVAASERFQLLSDD